jgi:hypothetical protein
MAKVMIGTVECDLRSVKVASLMEHVDRDFSERHERMIQQLSFQQHLRTLADTGETLGPLILATDPDNKDAPPTILQGVDDLISAFHLDKSSIKVLFIDKSDAPEIQRAINRTKQRATEPKDSYYGGYLDDD